MMLQRSGRQFERTVGNTSYVPREPDFDPDRLDVAWEYPGSPVVSDGTAYFSTDGEVHAVDALTGEVLWESEHIPAGHRTVAYDMVFVSGEKLTALDTNDGTIVW